MEVQWRVAVPLFVQEPVVGWVDGLTEDEGGWAGGGWVKKGRGRCPWMEMATRWGGGVGGQETGGGCPGEGG